MQVTGFAEKGAAGPGVINTGHYVLPTDLLAGRVGPASFSFELDYLTPAVAQRPFGLFVTEGLFIDIGVPEDYARAQDVLRPWA